ncbi:aminotransferase class I/II-fold pyridoxal phosphate-dependent enzyme [Anaerolineales bacterium HSG24]|nr:aminotransferase class I/II-fold pyridoxal phosphate-dependent enzyme [Anaerolineales bacterium HSG24]
MLIPAKRVNALPKLFFAELNKRIAVLQKEGADIIRLDAGSPDLAPNETILSSLKTTTDNPTQHGYGGYRGQPYLREAIATYYQNRFGVTLTDDELYPLIGSKEGLANLHFAWLNPGDLSLIPDPCYTAYQTVPILVGARTESFPLLPERGWLPDLSAISQESAKAARMMWLNYPNNPSGAPASLEFFQEAVNFCRKYQILLCHDAPYTDVTFDGYRAPSLLEVPGAKEVVIEFNSFSKTYNMAGWRVGMAVGNSVAVQALAKIKTQIDSGLGKPIQRMAATALTSDQSWLTERNAIYQERRDLCLNLLSEMGIEACRPVGGLYVWFKTPDGYSSVEFQLKMLEEAHVSLSPGTMYGQQGRGWMRLSFVSDVSVLTEALERMKKLLT